MRKFLCNFIPHQPPYQLEQKQSIDWMKQLHQLNNKDCDPAKIDKLFNYFSVPESKISTRWTFLEDFTHTHWNEHSLIGKNNFNPDISQRCQFAQSIIQDIMDSFYLDAQSIPDQVLHVTCTHYHSPSAAQIIVNKKQWYQTPVTHLYHMGCYAALPAIRTASALVADGNSQIDINHTELCSFHFAPNMQTAEQVIVQTLFADGAIHYQMHDRLPDAQSSFELVAQHEVLMTKTDQEMQWGLGSNHFTMSLSKKVPTLIRENIFNFFDNLFQLANLDFLSLKDSCEFAIHPGGPKIIDGVAKALALHSLQFENSRKILKSRGNMSSATLPHIWGKILEEPHFPYVATVAFGPGLTMTGALFKVW